MEFQKGERGQLVLVSGVAMAFSILLIAGMTRLSLEMDADRDIEPSLGPEFAHVKAEFEKAMIYEYNQTNESADKVFDNITIMFVVMEFYSGLHLDFQAINITGTQNIETLKYRMILITGDQTLEQEGVIFLKR